MERLIDMILPRSIRRSANEDREEEQRRLLAEDFRRRVVRRDAEHRRTLGERTFAELTRDSQFIGRDREWDRQ